MLPVLSYDIIDEESNLCLGAAIWMLDQEGLDWNSTAQPEKAEEEDSAAEENERLKKELAQLKQKYKTEIRSHWRVNMTLKWFRILMIIYNKMLLLELEYQ